MAVTVSDFLVLFVAPCLSSDVFNYSLLDVDKTIQQIFCVLCLQQDTVCSNKIWLYIWVAPCHQQK